jgi:hypothetical protein
MLASVWLMFASAGAMSAESSVQMLVSVEEETKHPFNYTQLETTDLFYLDSLVSKSPSLAKAILIVANRCDATPTVNAMRFIGANSKSIMNAHDGDKWRSTFDVNSDDCLQLQQINAHISQAGSLEDLARQVYDNPSPENRQTYASALQHTLDAAQSMANAVTR